MNWTLAHVAALIALNGSYTLAEISENSFEKWIKPYRYISVNNCRQSSISEENVDSLRLTYLQSYDIRQFDKKIRPRENEDGKVWSFKSS